MEAPPRNLTVFKRYAADIFVPHTRGGLVESIRQWVRAALATEVDLHNIKNVECVDLLIWLISILSVHDTKCIHSINLETNMWWKVEFIQFIYCSC